MILLVPLSKWEGPAKAKDKLAGATQAKQAGKPGGAYGSSKLQRGSLAKEHAAIAKQHGLKNVETKEQEMEDGRTVAETVGQHPAHGNVFLRSTSMWDGSAMRHLVMDNEANTKTNTVYGMGASADGAMQNYAKQKVMFQHYSPDQVKFLASKYKDRNKQSLTGLQSGELVEDK